MVRKRFLLPWQKKYIIVCPKCGGKIETRPLWFWEKRSNKLDELQLQFCHVIDSEFLEKIPVLSENDWKSKQRWDAMWKELRDEFGRMRPYEELEDMFKIEKGLPKIFSKYGIFAPIPFFTGSQLETLFLFLCLEPGHCPKQVWFQLVMEISRSYVSTILKKLQRWGLIQAWRAPARAVRGRARGRQQMYELSDGARKILDQDLRNYDFFRDAVIQTVGPIAERSPTYHWRKDLVKTND